MTTSLAEALAAFQAEAPKFAKSKTAKVQTRDGGSYTYKYADLADIVPVVNPLLAKHGLSWSSKPSRAEDGEPTLCYRLLHVSGEADAGEMSLGVDRHCKPQELGSALTYMRRYALTAQLNLVTDEDDDGQMAQKAARSSREPGAISENGPTAADIGELKQCAHGLTMGQIKMALTSVGVEHPNGSNLFARVPKPKVPLLAEALSSMERER